MLRSIISALFTLLFSAVFGCSGLDRIDVGNEANRAVFLGEDKFVLDGKTSMELQSYLAASSKNHLSEPIPGTPEGSEVRAYDIEAFKDLPLVLARSRPSLVIIFVGRSRDDLQMAGQLRDELKAANVKAAIFRSTGKDEAKDAM